MKKIILLSIILSIFTLICKGQWTFTNLSEAKENMGAASCGTKAFFAGGNKGSVYYTKVEVYDVVNGTWSFGGNLTQARMIVKGISYGSRVFFAGGFDWDVSYATVDIYNTITHQWSTEQLSVDRFSIAAVCHGGKVMFAGGVQYPPIGWLSVVDIYDTLTGSWTTTNLSEAREGIASGVVGDLAFFAGGINNSVSTDKVDIYNFNTGTWSTANLSCARAYASATTVGNKILFAGGATALFATSNVVDIYDVSTGLWSTASLSWPRCAMNNAVTLNGKAYFVGGGSFLGNGFNTPSDVVDIYDPTSNTWSAINLLEPLVNHSVLGVGNCLLAGGGINDLGIVVPKVEILDVTVGMNHLPEEESLLSVYPNPGNGEFVIKLNRKNDKTPFLISIYNLQGQLLLTQECGKDETVLKLDLNAGVYLLTVNSPDDRYSTLLSIQ